MFRCENIRPPSSAKLFAVFVFTALAMATVAGQAAYAQDVSAGLTPPTDPAIYQESLAALTKLFVLAILIENALAVIFNWRVFLAYFNLRGIKTLVLIAVAWSAVEVLDINAVSRLLEVYGMGSQDNMFLINLLTALILAGGSSGVNNLMVALGFRDASQIRQETPKPPENKAWIAVRAKRQKVQGQIQVRVSKVSSPAGPPPAAIAGSIGRKRPSLRDLLLRNPDRFPQSGGYVVEPGVVYEVAVEGRDAENNPVKSAIDGQYVFAPGAIVDFEVTL